MRAYKKIQVILFRGGLWKTRGSTHRIFFFRFQQPALFKPTLVDYEICFAASHLIVNKPDKVLYILCIYSDTISGERVERKCNTGPQHELA